LFKATADTAHQDKLYLKHARVITYREEIFAMVLK